jgi:hypothetical protein
MSDSSREASGQRAQSPSDPLLLAAIERAIAQQANALPAVTAAAVLEHLGVGRRSAVARHVRARLALLCAAGLLTRARRHGVWTWAPTAAGARHLAGARRDGRLPELAEAPQHRAWRSARLTASHELERFRRRLGCQLARAEDLLAAEPAPHSDSWLELGEELRRSCWRVASAGHCLHEWPEPDDAVADVDDRREPGDQHLDPAERARRRALRLGRRNVRLW